MKEIECSEHSFPTRRIKGLYAIAVHMNSKNIVGSIIFLLFFRRLMFRRKLGKLTEKPLNHAGYSIYCAPQLAAARLLMPGIALLRNRFVERKNARPAGFSSESLATGRHCRYRAGAAATSSSSCLRLKAKRCPTNVPPASRP